MKKIALVGQTNVGKSTLFNRLVEEEKAIVSQVPGTTRDLNYGVCSWQNQDFIIIDTGGVKAGPVKQELKKEIKQQIIKALKQADLVFFMVEIHPLDDQPTGKPISDFEREINRLIKKEKKPCWLILNKADSPKKRAWAQDRDWLKFGLGKPFPISAANGTGIGDLLDKATKYLGESKEEKEEEKPTKVAIIGRPNVGKSTLLNALLKEEMAIVSNQPHTTRGPQNNLTHYWKKPFLLIDTAGIRRKTKIKQDLEKIGVQKSLAIIKKSDVVLIILEAGAPVSHQDRSLIRIVEEQKKGLIIIFNKCDLIKISERPREKLVSWAPHIFVSAKEKNNIAKIFPLINSVQWNRTQWLEKEQLTNFLEKIILEKGWVKNFWAKADFEQVRIKPPKFTLFVPKSAIKRNEINPAQINIIKKSLREKWPFKGTLIEVSIKPF